MRRILTLLLSLLLLCGCAAQHSPGTQPATQPATEALPVAEGLQDLTNETVRAVSPRQLSAMEDGLLLSNAEGRLVKLDWQELRVVADVTLEISDLAYVQALDRAVGISDPGLGTVTLLDQDLKVEQVIPCDADTKTWMLKRDGSEVYTLSSQGIRAHELATGAERELLHCRTLSILFLSGESVLLGAVGTEDLMSRYYVLDLTTGTLAEPTGARLEAIRKGLSPQQDGGYLLVDREKAVCYDEQGRFRDSCAHPGEGIGLSSFLWSDVRQGWFVLEYGREGSRLLFWEPADGAEGEDLDLSPEVIPEGGILPRELYDRAAELSERFDLDIRIADQAVRDYTGYDSELLTDPEVTAQALDELEALKTGSRKREEPAAPAPQEPPELTLYRTVDEVPETSDMLPYVSRGSFDIWLRANADSYADSLRKLNACAMVNSIGHILMLRGRGIRLIGGPALNVTNHKTLEALTELGMEPVSVTSPELLDKSEMAGVPLMVTEHEMIPGTLTDRKGAEFRVEFDPVVHKTYIYANE